MLTCYLLFGCQTNVQIMRQQWQEHLEQCQNEIDNEGLRLDRIFDDTEEPYENPAEGPAENAFEDASQDDYSGMPPLELASYSDEVIRAISDDIPLDAREIAFAEHIDNIIQVHDRDAFLNSMIQYFNNIDPTPVSINEINDINNINNLNNINNVNNDLPFDQFLA